MTRDPFLATEDLRMKRLSLLEKDVTADQFHAAGLASPEYSGAHFIERFCEL